MDPDELTHHIDALLCITSNSADHASALMALEVGLAGLVIVGSEHDQSEQDQSLPERVRRERVRRERVHRPEPKPKPTTTRLDAFLRLQDRFEYNITSVLLHWLGSSIVIITEPRIDPLEDTELLRSNLIRCLGLLQGLLLIHRPSRALFVRRSAVQSLLAVLDLSRPSHVCSPLLSHPPVSPSPIHFPRSPTTTTSHHHPSTPRTARSNSPPSSLLTSTSPPNRTPPPPPTQTQTNFSNPQNNSSQLISLAALETLLCAVVDRPQNMRTFEQVRGLATIVKMLKDKTVGQSVRIKIIELLYYFLLPEQEPHTSNSPHLSPTPNEIDSPNPKPRPHTPPPPPPPITSTRTSPIESTLKRNLVLPREERLAHASRDFVPQTPVKLRRFRNRSRSGSGSDEDLGDSSPSEEVEEREKEEDKEDERTPRRPNGNDRTLRSDKKVVLVGKRVTRTTKEKKEMLRKVMPNVDALEERFKAMGLGLGLGLD